MEHQDNHRRTEQDDDVTVSGWTVEHYARMVKWPSLIAIVLNIIVTTAGWSSALIWLFIIALTIFLGIMTANIYHGTIGNAAGLGFTAGLIVGVFTSLFQFLWYHNLESFFQVVTTSLLAVLVGVLMSTSAFLVLAREHRPSEIEKRRRLQKK